MKNIESAPSAPETRLAFGDFLLDARERRVTRGGDPINLTPRQFDALLLFAEHAGELLDKETLLAALWPGLVVEDNNLNQLISALRRALNDSPQASRYIQTVPRSGFRFIAAVSRPAGQEANQVTIAIPAAPAPALNGGDAERRRWLIGGAVALVTAGTAAAWIALRRQPASDSSTVTTTLAVLPFKPLVTEGRNELLEIGMADSLIAGLSRVPGLVVTSIGSVRRYAGPDQDALQAARELAVQWVVDGSLQTWGDQVRVTARLLRAADGTAAWSGSFDQPYTGMFDVQNAISERVAGVLRPQLQPRSAAALASGATRNFDAYQLYLAARQHAQSIRADGLARSVELYRKAIELDPRYALAYAGQAETYRRMVFGADGEPRDVLERARTAAQGALQIEPQLAEAHAALGWVRFWYEWDWPGAEQAFRRALALNPNVVEAHFGLGLLLLTLDRADEGMGEMRAARELDPLSLILNSLEAGFQLNRGEVAEGRARLARVLEIAPDFWVAHLTRAGFHLADGQPELAIEALQRADRLADRSTQAAGLLGHMLARQGRRDDANAILNRLLALARERYVPPTSMAMIHAGLGNVPAALDQLERAYEARDPRLAYMKDDPRWASLRGEPRYTALLKRMKLDGFGPGVPAN